ncbi:retrotransposon protein, putative, ty1-copia subclass [Tanacetum coccineum]
MVPTKKGCEALVKRDTPDKLQQRSVKFIFIGYPKKTMGYYFYFPPENKIIVVRYAEFLEKNILSQEVSGRAKECKEIQGKDTSPFENTSKIPIEVEGFEPPQEEVVPVYPKSNKWIDAINAEMQSLKDNQVWCLVDLPSNFRLVTKGYTQTYGVDYEETFSPVADITAIRILIAIATFYDYEIWKMDVKTPFLNGYLNEDIYMQASRSWNTRFYEEIKRFGFAQNLDEPCVYQKASGSNVTFLILYVDDIIIMGNYIPSLQSVKSYLGKVFAMKDLGEASFILGIKIYRDRSKQLIELKRLDLNKTQGASTPEEVKRMPNVPYASAVGSIMYAVFSTWMAFRGNTRNLGSFREETDEITDLHQILEEVLLTACGDGVAGIKRRRRDPSGDNIRDFVTASGRGRLNEDLESST